MISLDGEYENNNVLKPTKVKFNRLLAEKWGSLMEAGKTLISQPYLKYLLILGFADFGLMARYLKT